MRQIALSVCMLLLAVSVVRADEKDDAAVLSQTLDEIRAALPARWEAKLSLGAERNTKFGIAIQTREPIACHFLAMNLGGDEKDSSSPPTPTIYAMQLESRPFFTKDQYSAAVALNKQYQARRDKMEKEVRAKVAWHFTGSDYLPGDFKPKNEAEQELINRFAMVWLNTELAVLPTHWRGTIAFLLQRPETTYIVDQPREQERVAILKRINEILMPYAKD